MSVDPRTPVGALVGERLGRSQVLERLGIDYCCGGKVPLAEACAGRGLDVAAVVRELEDWDARAGADAGEEVRGLGLGALADHIEATHHAYLHAALPQLAAQFDKVVAAHGANHPELAEARAVLGQLRAELESHMFKEEKVLFPLIRQLEAASSRPTFHCGSINNPIRVMEHEHDQAGSALARLQELTGGYRPPEDACTTYRALLQGLSDLEADLHRHIHKENNVLFPRAAELEARLAG